MKSELGPADISWSILFRNRKIEGAVKSQAAKHFRVVWFVYSHSKNPLILN